MGNGSGYNRYAMLLCLQRRMLERRGYSLPHAQDAKKDQRQENSNHNTMRTIKFRGRTFNDTIWAYGLIEMLRFDDSTLHYYIREYKQNGGYTDYEVDPETIGQFTGLYDKNGKGIYEGDILLYRGDIKIEVKYHHGGFGYTYIDTDFLFGGNNNFNFHRDDKDSDFEVIGSIHDNKELLTQN